MIYRAKSHILASYKKIFRDYLNYLLLSNCSGSPHVNIRYILRLMSGPTLLTPPSTLSVLLISSVDNSDSHSFTLPHSSYADIRDMGLGYLVTMADTFSSPAPEDTCIN